MKRRRSIESAVFLLLCWGAAACQRTADGIKRDTRAATAAASEQAEQTKGDVQAQVDDFKATTSAQLERLS